MKCVLYCGSKVIKEIVAYHCYDAIKDMWDYLTITDDVDEALRLINEPEPEFRKK